MKTSHVLILLLATGLTACSAKKSVSVSASGSAPYASPSALIGTWKTDCYAVSGGGAYQIQMLSLGDNSFSSGVEIYTDSACTNAFPGSPNQTIVGTYEVTGTDPNLAGAADLTLHFTDPDGSAQTGYSLALLDGSSLYMPSYMGLNEQSRPISVDRTVAFHKQ
jgi:hypothetical protein